MECRVREPHIALAVEAYTMELQLHVIVAVASRVEDDASRFIDLDERAYLERRMSRQRRDQLPAEIVEIQVRPAVALRFQDEPPAVLEEVHRGTVVDPAGRPLLADDDARGAGVGIGSDELQDVLAAVGTVEDQLPAVG